MAANWRYFTRQELLSSGGVLQTLPPELEDNLLLLGNALDKFRAAWGHPIYITSGYRTPERNAAVGGVPNSLHTKALAADCYSDPFDSFVDFCLKEWAGGVGVYSNFVHLDLGMYRRWRA